MINPTFPSFFPLKIYDIDINTTNTNFIDKNLIEQKDTFVIKMLENISCKKSKDIDADIMNKINNKYYFLKKKMLKVIYLD